MSVLAGQTGCHPSYPGVCLPPAGPDVNCGDPILGGRTDIRVVGVDTYGLDGDNDGIGCESGDRGAGSTTRGGAGGSGPTGSGDPTLASTGSSTTAGLAALSAGMLLLGSSAVSSARARRWFVTAGGDVRYTIDQRLRGTLPRSRR